MQSMPKLTTQKAPKRKCIEVIDAEELFHQMYNPYFDQWKSKKSQYVKYEKLQQANKKRKFLSQFRPVQFSKEKNLEISEKDKYYAKEVRTFDEVFKQIKTKQKEHELKK